MNNKTLALILDRFNALERQVRVREGVVTGDHEVTIGASTVAIPVATLGPLVVGQRVHVFPAGKGNPPVAVPHEADGGFTSPAEPLREVRGIVLTTSPGSITEGAGFTLARNGTGDVTLTFDTAFTDVPTPTAMATGTAGARTVTAVSVSTTALRLACFSSTTGAAVDSSIGFRATGPG